VPSFSGADHTVSPPKIHVPRDYNAAHDLIEVEIFEHWLDPA